MKKLQGKRFGLNAFALALAGFACVSVPVVAQDDSQFGSTVDGNGNGGGGGGGGFFSDMGVSFSGFIRFDSAFRTDNDENPNNQRGNIFNGIEQDRNAFPANVDGLLGILGGLDQAVVGPLISTIADNNPIAAPATRSVPRADNDWNLNQLRGKFDLGLTLSQNVQLYSSIRTIYDFGNYDNFDPDSVDSTAAGFNQQEPEFFEYDDFNSGGCQNYLEVCGEKYMADFTALYLDITLGPVLVRAGQQQIAWGQALFFRVFDVPNGLDLRRHLILDDALEEYADERVAAPGLRVTWQATDQWEVDSYAQMFVPTTFPNANTPYNVIPSQFSVHETWSDRHKDSDFNYGLRLRGNFGNWGLQFIATQRWNHEGTFRWTESGVNKDLPGLPGTGLIMQATPLEADPTGVWSANEWFTYAGQVRLDGLEGLNTLIREFAPATVLLTGATVGDVAAAAEELDLFFAVGGGLAQGNLAGGGLRGHIIHEYHKEEIYGAGISYVVEGDPGSLIDQLIINFETSYIPDRVFTEKSLSRNFTVEDESVSALVMEKYHRWFEEFPATYMVFQAIHKTESNLFGQHLGCQGGTGGSPGTLAGNVNPDTKQCTKQSGGSTDVVLAFLQPFPNYIYRLTGAALLDVDGGLLVQGGFRWSPGNDLTFDFIYNYLDGGLYGDKNTNAIENIEWADEFVVRAAYQF